MVQEGIPEFLLLMKELGTADGISESECQAGHDPKDGPTCRSTWAAEMKLMGLKRKRGYKVEYG